nr:ribonuclease H-like domain-containing protein [Tanacetum cinerariifolium]
MFDLVNVSELNLTVCILMEPWLKLLMKKVLGTGSESASLYLFDSDCAKFAMCINSKFLVCHVSKNVWHNTLSHPVNHVLKLLKGSLHLSNIDNNSPCEVCHKAKQTREPFLLSEHKSTCLGELLHLDVWGPYKVVSREGYRLPSSVLNELETKTYILSPNDKEEGSLGRDGSVHQLVIGANTDHPGHNGTYLATPIDENNSSKGNVGTFDEVHVFQIDFPNTTEEVGLIRDANHIRTLGDYSKPSHEGYKNTIELPIGNNMVNKITTSCEICGGSHNTQYCLEDPEQAFVEYASLRTNETGSRPFTMNQGPRSYNKVENESKEEGSVEPSKTEYTNRENANKTNEEVESERKSMRKLEEKPKKKMTWNTLTLFPI